MKELAPIDRTFLSEIIKVCGTDFYQYKFTVDERRNGYRLDQFVKVYLGNRISREYVKKKINQGDIRLLSYRGMRHEKQQSLRPSLLVFKGEVVEVMVYKSEHLHELNYEHWGNDVVSIETTPTIVHEDDELIVISKPPFMVTYPTGRHSFNAATTYFEGLYKRKMYSIHRIDRETSGLLLLGKSSSVGRDVSDYFAKGQVQKVYFLISKKNESRGRGDITFPLLAEERIDRANAFSSRILMQTFPKESDQGKEAQTLFDIIDEEKGYLLLLAFPKTGRQHQIRVHAAHHGFPLIGDKIYGGDYQIFLRYKDKKTTEDDYEKLEIPRHALHAVALSFPSHSPFFQKRPHFYRSSLPLDLTKWIQDNLSISPKEVEDKVIIKVNSFFKQSLSEDNYL